MRARMVIGENRISQHAKVRKLREFGVPESVILDYLANVQEKNRGVRYGPRTRDEVWTRAGQLLLRYYDLDAHRPSDPPAAAGHPADPPAAPVGIPAAGGTPRRADDLARVGRTWPTGDRSRPSNTTTQASAGTRPTGDASMAPDG